MTWVIPAELEEIVHAAAREVIGEAPLETAALVAAIVDRSMRYTSERDRRAADRVADLAARAAFFTLADAMKIAIPLGELAGRGLVPATRPLRVVDVGAGCGAMSLGLVASIPAAYSITAIDRDVDALRIAAAALRALGRRRDLAIEITTRVADVETTTLPGADLVVLGTVLNELAAPARLALVEHALAAIDRTGAVIVIEPALRETSRALHELRDALLARGVAHVFAPCTRGIAPCPALADESDWCHEDRNVTLPPRTAELARLTHLRDGGMKFSYLVLRRDPAPLVEASGAWRIVSAPMPGKGKHEIYGCSDAGRVQLRLLKRNRSDANRAFERARRGDVVVAETPEIGPETRVERHDAAGR